MKITSREMKKYLAENNIETKDISIRCHYYSVDTSVIVTLKNLKLPINKIKNLLTNKFEKDRGFAGGNIFIEVKYDNTILNKAIKDKLEIANKYLNKIMNSNNSIIMLVCDKDFKILINKKLNQISVKDKYNSYTWRFIEDINLAKALVYYENREI